MTDQKSEPDNRQYHHGDLRRALLDAAVEVIREKGVRELSLRGVARRVGVSHMAPYNHFADRDALVAAVAAEGFRELAREMKERMARQSDPLDRLQASGIAYVVFAVKHPDHFRLMFGPVASDKANHPEELATAAQETLDLLMGALRSSASSGAIDSSEEQKTALLAWSAVHGLAMLLVSDQLGASSPEQAESIAEEVTAALYLGLSSGHGRPGDDAGGETI